MVLRPRIRHAVLTASLGALIVPATAGAAVKPPVITKVTPKTANVGDTLLVQGRYFRVGKGKNTLLFKRDGGKALFLKAGLSTSTKIMIVVPPTLEKFMAVKNGSPVASRFRIRVLTTRLGKQFTATAVSPVIGPAQDKSTGTGGGGTGGGATGAGGAGGAGGSGGSGGGSSTPTCPVGGPNGDDDGDLLSNAQEQSIGTDPCNADTDGDGVSDAFEYWSALDLNRGNASISVPYPGKRPYPNPLDPSDANTDHDGDVLTLKEEYELWVDPRYGNKNPVLDYSDGKQTTVAVPAPSAADRLTPSVIYANDPTMRWLDANHDGTIDSTEVQVLDFNHDGTVDAGEFTYQDLDGNGILSDDERDADADGLTNYAESHGPLMGSSWWSDVYTDETSYKDWVPFQGTDFLNPDSDGDGIVDGLDDQDDDGFLNVQEQSRVDAQVTGQTHLSAYGQVNPFNPCLPAQALAFTDLNTLLPTTIVSPDCMRHPPASGGPAPYDTSPKYPNYEIKN